jgi:hypothetical protein
MGWYIQTGGALDKAEVIIRDHKASRVNFHAAREAMRTLSNRKKPGDSGSCYRSGR